MTATPEKKRGAEAPQGPGLAACPLSEQADGSSEKLVLAADEDDSAGEGRAQSQQEDRGGTVEKAFEGDEVGNRHDTHPLSYGPAFRALVMSPRGGGAVRSGQCLDSTYLNGVKINLYVVRIQF